MELVPTLWTTFRGSAPADTPVTMETSAKTLWIGVRLRMKTVAEEEVVGTEMITTSGLVIAFRDMEVTTVAIMRARTASGVNISAFVGMNACALKRKVTLFNQTFMN